ncbi:MAG: hypothetical protein RBG1_1C00001G0878 [candidate division Zixibacteria bacterium RBG-1]|nr:MAG: hypothetical protein RBG1_1C00001G0878 [candidate division Zixibacteria bacterium RBG-1]OGC83651.1 MAG: alanine racemase [candidate division Zixibacteria bacterium RBG_19FT_COMBO_42_43]
MKAHKFSRPAWLEVDLKALAYNCRNIKQKLGKNVELMAVVKADGYGIGAVECSKVFLKNGATSLGVAIVEEAIQLRKVGIKSPILIIYPEAVGREELVVKYKLDQVVCELKFAQNLSRIAKRNKNIANVFLKVDTGMGRYGFTPEETVEFAKRISKLPNLKIKGIMSHFSSAFMKDKTYSYEELSKFRKTLQLLNQAKIDIPIKSLANSSGVLDIPESYFNQARVGILLYGIYPSLENEPTIMVKPAASLKAKISFLKKVFSSTPISYMRTFHTNRESVIATVPMGYCDGYNFFLSNKGKALVHGKLVPLIGRICMDTLMLDVTDVPDAKIGDEVVFVGTQNGSEISVWDVGEWAGTMAYDIITRMGKRLPRIYKK